MALACAAVRREVMRIWSIVEKLPPQGCGPSSSSVSPAFDRIAAQPLVAAVAPADPSWSTIRWFRFFSGACQPKNGRSQQSNDLPRRDPAHCLRTAGAGSRGSAPGVQNQVAAGLNMVRGRAPAA